MVKKMHIDRIKIELKKLNLNGWLLYDFRRSNDIACHLLGLSPATFLSRRWIYWIPLEGNPVKIVHKIEREPLAHLPGQEVVYATWQEWQTVVRSLLQKGQRIALEYSPLGILPIVSKVDAGFADLVRSCGVELVSSLELVQEQTVPLTLEQMQSHFFAASTLNTIVEETWDWIVQQLKQHRALDEYHIQQFIQEAIARAGLITEGPPICAVNANSADPHYFPTAGRFQPISQGDWLLIDLSAKESWPGAIFGDLTRVAYLGSSPTVRLQEIFGVVRQARDNAIALVRDRLAAGQEIQGWEVDACCRKVIQEAGYGDYFIHRTGHSIDTHDHGSGTNLDDYETHDTRRLLLGSCFSIEPGIYLPGEFGVRLEENLLVDEKGNVTVTPGMQHEIRTLPI